MSLLLLLVSPVFRSSTAHAMAAAESAPSASFLYAEFGCSLANLGDLDGDGEEELAIGAPEAGPGALLIVSIPSGRLLRTIESDHQQDLFGSTLRLLPRAVGGPLLAVGGRASWDQGNRRRRSWILDPKNGALVHELVGTSEIMGGQRDIDGDGVGEIVARTMRSSGLRVEYLSGASGQPIPGREFDPDLTLTGLDLDSDGLLEFVREPRSNDHDLEFVSGASGSTLRRLQLASPAQPLPWGFASLAADIDGDAVRDFIFTCSDTGIGSNQILAMRGPKFDQSRRLSKVVSKPRLSCFAFEPDRQDLFTIGDLNGDGCDEVLVSDHAFARDQLTCRNGVDGKTIWRDSDQMNCERTSVVRVRDLDGDGVQDLACGWIGVRASTSPGIGQVRLMSGKSGSLIRQLEGGAYDPVDIVRLKSSPAPKRKPEATKAALNPLVGVDPEYALFGLSVVNLGDNDEDGEAELAIGAPGAWTDAGRTGAVLILGARRGRLLRMIPGVGVGSMFGERVSLVAPRSGSKQRLLGVEVGGRRLIFNPRTGELVSEEATVLLDRPLGFDVDEDGLCDALRPPKSGDRELTLFSAKDGRELRRLPLETPLQLAYSGQRISTVAADLDGDGRKDLAVVSPHSTNSSSLVYFRGKTLEERISSELIPAEAKNCSRERLVPDLYACGDLDGDGREEILVATVAFPWEQLDCRSGETGSSLWSLESAVVATRTSIDSISDVDGDEVNDILCGKVLFLPQTPQYDFGEVLVLSGKTGRVVSLFRESDYSQISLERYLVQHGD